MISSSQVFSKLTALAAGALMMVAFTSAANAATATLYSAGVRAWPASSPPGGPYNFLTQPAGALFVGSHLWVGDGMQGTRLDAFGTYMPMPGISTPYASLNSYYSAAVFRRMSKKRRPTSFLRLSTEDALNGLKISNAYRTSWAR